ncbi:hypothetical protein GCM10023196_094940 [Actinoallomurus vinaceus]|uniref:DUF4395 domain-containing protein n=1 Tax=Actinoallomurus vinaceus TaxID=1080074 RepID=A0ABP8USD3_9ACTN
MARRVPEYEKRRNSIIGFLIVFVVLCTMAWDSGKLSYWGLPLMILGAYELLLVPTRCRATTTRKGSCRNPCYGLLRGCRHQPSHGPGKRADLLRTLTAGRSQAIPSPADGTAALKSQPIPDPDTVTVEPAQRLVIAFTILGGITGVVQTVLAALSMH